MGCWLGEMKCCSMELEIGCSQGITYRWDLSINLTWTTLKYHQSHTKGKLKYHQSHTQKESYFWVEILFVWRIFLLELECAIPFSSVSVLMSVYPNLTVHLKFTCPYAPHIYCMWVRVGSVGHTAWGAMEAVNGPKGPLARSRGTGGPHSPDS